MPDWKWRPCIQPCRERWNNAAEMYSERSTKIRPSRDLYSNLNHLSKLTSQLEYLRGAIAGDGTTRIAYTTSQGEPTAAIIGKSNAFRPRPANYFKRSASQ